MKITSSVATFSLANVRPAICQKSTALCDSQLLTTEDILTNCLNLYNTVNDVSEGLLLLFTTALLGKY